MSDATRVRTRMIGCIAAMLAIPFIASPALAQDARSNTRGLLLGLNASGASARVEDGQRESGGGAGLTIGWGVSRQVTIFLRSDVTKVDITDPDIEGNYSVGIADIGVRISFRDAGDRFIPFIVAAFSAQRAAAEVFFTPTVSSDIEISGPGFTIGGGFSHFFVEQLALDVSVLLMAGRFNQIRIGSLTADIGDLDSQATRLNVGLAWYPITQR
ncbi:MAG TPA: hypothetical protein VMM79_00625 [Longimicrobiales bacterium]|nr:hypothetical protein [Longimicrobiales bacterium]